MLCMYNKCVIFESSEQYMVQSFIISHHREKFLWTDFLILLPLYGKGVSIAFGGIGMTLGVTAGAIVIRHGHRSDHGAGKDVEA